MNLFKRKQSYEKQQKANAEYQKRQIEICQSVIDLLNENLECLAKLEKEETSEETLASIQVHREKWFRRIQDVEILKGNLYTIHRRVFEQNQKEQRGQKHCIHLPLCAHFTQTAYDSCSGSRRNDLHVFTPVVF